MVAAVASLSGAWFNDPNTVDDIQMGFLKSQINMKWDDLKLSDTGAVLQTHGGEGRDVWPQPGGMDSQLQMAGIQPDENGQVRIISFENSAQFAKDFLPAHNRTLVDCAHENGHTNHPGIWGSVVIDFLKIHKAGTQSPILTDGLPAGIAPHCTLVNQ